MARHWLTALIRALVASALVFVLAHVPPPSFTPLWVAYIQVPLLMFGLLCYLGKLLYDTLFYDHYH